MRWLVSAALLGVAAPLFAASPAIMSPPVVEPAINTSSAAWRVVTNTAFVPNETCVFAISWGVIKAGEASLIVKSTASIGGRMTYQIAASAKSTGVVDTFYRVRDENDSWLDAASLESVRFERHIHEGQYRVEETTEIDQRAHRYTQRELRLDKHRVEDTAGEVPPDVLDVLGSLYYVRTLPLAPGQTYSFDVLSGRKVYPLLVTVRKKETIRVPAGKFVCLLVEPKLRQPGIFISKGKKLEVWLTDDARHMPVRMRSEVFIGHVSADLIRYSARQ